MNWSPTLQESADASRQRRLLTLLAEAATRLCRVARQPALVTGVCLAAFETVPTLYYGRSLAGLDATTALSSIALSFAGTAAIYFLLLRLMSRWRWARLGTAAVIALCGVTLQVIYFGIYREFAALPTVSIVDFVRQTPQYALALFRARLNLLSLCVFGLLVALVLRGVLWGMPRETPPGRPAVGIAAVFALASFAATREPFMTVSQQTAWLAFKSSHGPGVVNQAWAPERISPDRRAASHPVNIVIFRLEEIAARATTLERPELPTTPILAATVEQLPEEAFVARQHYANATATDVSVLSIYEGLSPAAELNAHQRVPMLWDYFTAAGYDTSLFVPFHLEWGKFKTRFLARPGVMNLNKVVDARASGLPLAYDNSINDTDVVRQAIAYQQQRGWAEPFLQIVSLKMPHAIGEGARVNKLSYDEWRGEPADLRDYYNGIRHDDLLVAEFLQAIPEEKRARTVRVYLSDHGTRLFTRSDGVEDLHRLDNYHQETTRVPFVVHVPTGAQQIVPREKVKALADNLSRLSTSNIDMVPTLLGIAGIRPEVVPMSHPEWLAGRDLTQAMAPTDVIVQLNTGPLRRWDREHFGLVLDNGSYHYMFSMGRELLFDLRADGSELKNLVNDQRHFNVLERGRFIASKVPELMRIRQKYRGVEAPATGMVSDLGAVQPLRAAVAPAEALRIQHTGERPRLLLEYALSPSESDSVIAVQFGVKVTGGAGRLEWRLRADPSARHFAHVETLRTGDSHGLRFLWQPRNKDAPELSIQLYGVAEEPGFTLHLEQADARLAKAKMDRELKLVALERQPIGPTLGIYHLDRFKEHACLQQGEVADCPNGYLVWGPYVRGKKGAEVQLRYDIDAERVGAKVWFDIAAGGGKERLARSRVYKIAEPGSHSFELSTRLASDADGIEGRLNANSVDNSIGHAIAVRRAELTLASPID